MNEKEPMKLSKFLDETKAEFIAGRLAPDELYDAFLQEGYTRVKAASLVRKWIKENPQCGFDPNVIL